MPAWFALHFPIDFGDADKSHNRFTYYFDDNEGITFGTYTIPVPLPWRYDYDLAIYYDTLGDDNFVDCFCTRWEVQDYNVVVETWLKKADFQTLLTHTRVGAVGELYRILGRPLFYDKSWDASNTIRLYPTPSSNLMNESTLNKMRRETLIYPKNITYRNLPTSEEWMLVKIEAKVSGQGDL